MDKLTFPIVLTLEEIGASGARRFISHVELPVEGTYTVGAATDDSVPVSVAGISRGHLILEASADAIVLRERDGGTTNGTFFNGERVTAAALVPGSEVVLANVVALSIRGAGQDTATKIQEQPKQERQESGSRPSSGSSISDYIIVRPGAEERARGGDEFPGGLFAGEIVSTAALRQHEAYAGEVDFLALGGGIGNFVWVDHLRVYGVPISNIRVIGIDRICYKNYERYCLNSQIPRHERLRSNAISVPDNVWGFPGYASRESFNALFRGGKGSAGAIFEVFGEPTLAQSYTPMAGEVFKSLDKEMARIGWFDMFINGRILSMRKTDDGRYAVAYRLTREAAAANNGQREQIVIGRYIHIGTGYPATRFVEDLQNFRSANPSHRDYVINAYDPHDAVYDAIGRSGKPVTVMIRGRGIVASRVHQRLVAEHDRRNANLRIIHLMRSEKPYGDGAKFRRAKRPVFNDVEIQPFNWPKACWGGSLRADIERMAPEERAETFEILGGTTTAERSDWTEMIERGTREGWYVKYYGSIERLVPDESGKANLEVRVKTRSATTEYREIHADYIIDCTGLIGDVTRSPFLKDLVETYHLPRNNAAPHGEPARLTGISVTPDFEILGLQNGHGHVYAAGQITGGGPYAAVDSFLGLQYSALRSVDHLHTVRAPFVSSFGPLKSFGQWVRWCQGVAP
ncbi:MAG: FHA domain-containing protein [Hyphomicrobiaceae bacterium]|nr:FHA domain-containing protein [Hyphomicrobiaceae bacterium]